MFSESQENDEFDVSPPQVATPTRQPTVAKLGSPMGTPGRDFLRSPSDYFPMIRRGHSTREVEPIEVVSSGWNVEITSRKEREESLRDDAHQFELKLKKFTHLLEQGIEVTMWQMNSNVEFGTASKDDFTLKSTQIQLKLQKRGDFLVQSALTFSMKGGYLSKALNRRRGKFYYNQILVNLLHTSFWD